MKRRVFLFIMAALLCAVSAAFAIELTWNQVCTKKTSKPTDLYVLIPGEDKLTKTSTLPAGTYIRTTGQTMEGKVGISYSANNRDPLYGYIDEKAITSASVSIRLPNGKTVTVGEALVRSKKALNLYLEYEYGVTLDGTTYTGADGKQHDIGDEDVLDDDDFSDGDAKYYSALSRAFAVNGAYTPTVYRDDAGNETEVNVVYMGVLRSMVEIGGEEQLVETWRLSWETEAPEEKVLAVVNPPENKLDTRIHSKKSVDSMVLGYVKAGRVVQVIRTGNDWSLVDMHEAGYPRVYINNACLDFWSNIPRDYRTAMITIKGRTVSKEEVGVRAGDGSEYKKVENFLPGDPLTVYAQNNRWCEVDIKGYHVFILNEFVTLDPDPSAEEPEEEPTEEPGEEPGEEPEEDAG